MELKFSDGSMFSIHCTAIENEVADNMHQRSEMNYPISILPLEYADLVLKG